MRLLTLSLIGICSLLLFTPKSTAQLPKSLAVMTWAKVSATPQPSITLRWTTAVGGRKMTIWRKLKQDANFPSNALIELDSNAIEWTDNDVQVGVSYEYRLIRDVYEPIPPDSISHYWATGYINSGILVPPAERKRVLALVDTTLIQALSLELDNWTSDLENEGWTVSIRAVERAELHDSAAVVRVRRLIRDEVLAGKRDLDAIFLVGRVPVPYAGNIRPDGHTDHTGAWPADGVYGDDNGTYTDRIVSIVNNSRKVNENLPNDGKYDQSLFASAIETPVGRVDFFNMPAFSKSELELLRDYFQKDHDFRTAQFPVLINGIIDDNFGAYGEGFAGSAWRGYSVFGTDTCVKAGDWFGSLAGPSTYLFAYGCGGGTDVSAGGVGTTTDMAANQVNAVHTQLFGSYFGDYDTQNNFLRSALATSPRALTCGWVGRPAWYIHHMALGETIGYSARLSQNNSVVNGNLIGNYIPNYLWIGNQSGILSAGDRGVHIALMGDPTLRAIMKPVAAVGQVTASAVLPNKVSLSWLRPVGDVDAYIVYRRTNPTDHYELITPQPITATSFTDSLLHDGAVDYRVNACAIRQTASGTYYDMGKGATSTVITVGIYSSEERGASSELLLASELSPNPANEGASVEVAMSVGGGVELSVVDVAGVSLWNSHFEQLAAGVHRMYIDAQQLPSGRYTVVVRNGTNVARTSMIVVH